MLSFSKIQNAAGVNIFKITDANGRTTESACGGEWQVDLDTTTANPYFSIRHSSGYIKTFERADVTAPVSTNNADLYDQLIDLSQDSNIYGVSTANAIYPIEISGNDIKIADGAVTKQDILLWNGSSWAIANRYAYDNANGANAALPLIGLTTQDNTWTTVMNTNIQNNENAQLLVRFLAKLNENVFANGFFMYNFAKNSLGVLIPQAGSLVSGGFTYTGQPTWGTVANSVFGAGAVENSISNMIRIQPNTPSAGFMSLQVRSAATTARDIDWLFTVEQTSMY